MKPYLVLIVLLAAPLAAFAQHPHNSKHQHGDANAYMHQSSIDELIARFDSPDRAAWQKPEAVIALMGNLAGKTVVDIGAGSGYFAFRLAKTPARVVAADVDEGFLAHLQAQQAALKLPAERFEVRKIPYESPGLAQGEADVVLLVNTYHHIHNRVAYFKQVLAGLKGGGRLMIVDYRKEETPQGPTMKHRISQQKVIDELKQAGFNSFEANTTLLPNQYIIFAGQQ